MFINSKVNRRVKKYQKSKGAAIRNASNELLSKEFVSWIPTLPISVFNTYESFATSRSLESCNRHACINAKSLCICFLPFINGKKTDITDKKADITEKNKSEVKK